MTKYAEIYQDNLLYVFNEQQIKDTDKKCMVIVKDNCDIIEDDESLTLHYSEDFEQYLKFKIPTKNRKLKQLISLNQCFDLVKSVQYGVLSFQKDEFPYSVGLNHIYYDNRIFFHGALKGYKLQGINRRATFMVIKDLGINEEVGTHNHEAVAIYGTLLSVDEFELKKKVLLELIQNLAPKHPINDRMIDGTQVLELKIEYVSGKSHIR